MRCAAKNSEYIISTLFDSSKYWIRHHFIIEKSSGLRNIGNSSIFCGCFFSSCVIQNRKINKRKESVMSLNSKIVEVIYSIRQKYRGGGIQIISGSILERAF